MAAGLETVRCDSYLASCLLRSPTRAMWTSPRWRRSSGRGRFSAGAATRARNRVLELEWDAGTATLTGTVVGNGALYSTCAFFSAGDGATVGV